MFKHLHEDAEHLYNTTMSLHAVVTQLTDRGKRLARKVSSVMHKVQHPSALGTCTVT